MGVIEGDVSRLELENIRKEIKLSSSFKTTRFKEISNSLKASSFISSFAQDHVGLVPSFENPDEKEFVRARRIVQLLLPPDDLWPQDEKQIDEMLNFIKKNISNLVSEIDIFSEEDRIASNESLKDRRINNLWRFSKKLAKKSREDSSIYSKAINAMASKEFNWEVANRYIYEQENIWNYVESIE